MTTLATPPSKFDSVALPIDRDNSLVIAWKGEDTPFPLTNFNGRNYPSFSVSAMTALLNIEAGERVIDLSENPEIFEGEGLAFSTGNSISPSVATFSHRSPIRKRLAGN